MTNFYDDDNHMSPAVRWLIRAGILLAIATVAMVASAATQSICGDEDPVCDAWITEMMTVAMDATFDFPHVKPTTCPTVAGIDRDSLWMQYRSEHARRGQTIPYIGRFYSGQKQIVQYQDVSILVYHDRYDMEGDKLAFIGAWWSDDESYMEWNQGRPTIIWHPSCDVKQINFKTYRELIGR